MQCQIAPYHKAKYFEFWPPPYDSTKPVPSKKMNTMNFGKEREIEAADKIVWTLYKFWHLNV